MAASDEGPYNFRSDGEPGINGYLGCFRRGPAVFSVYEVPPDQSTYPNEPGYNLIDVDDGVGARECCRIPFDPSEKPIWNGAWNNDEWCDWIIKRTKAVIADPDTD